ncbi:hypothetical protein KOR42_13990 [Thalassoglobus neptunius]|uniref:Uncharacterized protein n=1 Tax=Thalassoglobus neptunius TaxID=1938619 RepID=A0A5C5X544_9PLAN|nr:hypothetical protein KOR42_13990 [Thalassoglobus neptunius]
MNEFDSDSADGVRVHSRIDFSPLLADCGLNCSISSLLRCARILIAIRESLRALYRLRYRVISLLVANELSAQARRFSKEMNFGGCSGVLKIFFP